MTQFQTFIDDLQKVADAHEEAAKLLFVVCGKPDTQEGFELAWVKEDAIWYAEWAALCRLITILTANRKMMGE